MRFPTFSLLLTMVVVGCSEAPETPVASPTSTPAPQPTPPAPSQTATSPSSVPPAALPAAPSYPESQEVQAILYRARELRDAGKFQEALAATDQALAHDPNSPAAKALHGELVAIVTKI